MYICLHESCMCWSPSIVTASLGALNAAGKEPMRRQGDKARKKEHVSFFDLTSDFLIQPHFLMQHVTAETTTSRTWTHPSRVLHRLCDRSILPSQ